MANTGQPNTEGSDFPLWNTQKFTPYLRPARVGGAGADDWAASVFLG